MTRGIISQESFQLINQLAALCATPGIDDKTKDIANRQIQELLNGPVNTSLRELKASAQGIVTLM